MLHGTPNCSKTTVTGKYDQLFYKPWLKHGRFITGNVRLKNTLKRRPMIYGNIAVLTGWKMKLYGTAILIF